MEYIDISIEDIKEQIKQYNIPLNRSDIELKLAVFAIYDYRISSVWGSNSYEIISLMNRLLGTENININYTQAALETKTSKYYKYRIYIDNLFNFFISALQKECICEFGTKTHATTIYIKKYDDYINIVYINTGDGISINNTGINIDNNVYWNMFN